MLHITLEFSSMPSTEGPSVVVYLTLQIDMTQNFGLCQPKLLTQSNTDPDLITTVRDQVVDDTIALELCEQGTGGTYFVKDSDKRIAVFKPVDEEPGALNNPKSLIDSPILTPGGGAVREVIACVLDHEHRSGVPETYLLSDLEFPFWPSTGKPEKKTGSLQKFVPHFSAAADMGYSLFSVDDVHNIGILDIRLLNLDRNGENLLVVKDGGNHRLVPIDHSYILPPTIRKPFYEWLYWKQAKVPFSPDALKYIANLDIDRDALTLAAYGISSNSIRTMKISSLLLKKGASAGLSLFQIASLVCSDDESKKSDLESIVESAEMLSSGDELSFFQIFEQLVDSLVVRVSC